MDYIMNTMLSEQLVVTASARAKIVDLLEEADQSIDSVRIFVSGGGCGGMNYGMTFAESREIRDSVLEDAEGCKVVVDPIALCYLQGAEVDYVDDGVNTSFVFNNVFKAVGGSGACGGCGGAH
jgi:iron-sulfur cluster assembly accessory protein